MKLPDQLCAPAAEQLREIQLALAPIAERNGLPPPVENVAPEVYVGPGSDLREAAIKLGDICSDHRKGAFLSGREIVTIERERGGTEIMDHDRFRTWIADHALIGSKYDKATGRLEKCTLGCEASRGIIRSDHFRAKLPKLAGVNLVKQPVRRRDGRVELLSRGYDPESMIYTLEGGIDYDENVDINEAVVFLRALFGTFPWGDAGRSLAVHIAAGLTLFCRNMLPPGTLTPMFLYNANMAGSGKSLLVSVFLWALYGQAETMSIVEGKDEFKKELDACAQSLSPYAFFDDQSGFIENRLLNSWLTSRNWAGRVLGTSRKFAMPKRAVTFLTGNTITLSDDLGRRSMLSDLFSKQSLQDRKLPPETILITDSWMECEENRSKVLSALWALVKWSCVPREEVVIDPDGTERKMMWCGQMDSRGNRVRPKNRALDTFETWSESIPQMVVDASFADPLERPDLPDAGDKGSREMDKLMKAIIHKFMWREVPTFGIDPDTGEPVELPEKKIEPLDTGRVELSEFVAMARKLGLFSEILETTDMILLELSRARKGNGFHEERYPDGDKWVERMPETEAEKRAQAERHYDKSMSNKFSNRFRGKQGQYFTGNCGGIYQLGERMAARVSTFPIKRIK